MSTNRTGARPCWPMVRGVSQDAFSEMVILLRLKGCLVRWGGTHGAVAAVHAQHFTTAAV